MSISITSSARPFKPRRLLTYQIMPFDAIEGMGREKFIKKVKNEKVE